MVHLQIKIKRSINLIQLMKFILNLIIGISLELIYGKLINTFYTLYISLKFQEIFHIKSLPKSRPKRVLQVCCLWLKTSFSICFSKLRLGVWSRVSSPYIVLLYATFARGVFISSRLKRTSRKFCGYQFLFFVWKTYTHVYVCMWMCENVRRSNIQYKIHR